MALQARDHIRQVRRVAGGRRAPPDGSSGGGADLIYCVGPLCSQPLCSQARVEEAQGAISTFYAELQETTQKRVLSARVELAISQSTHRATIVDQEIDCSHLAAGGGQQGGRAAVHRGPRRGGGGTPHVT